MAMTDDGDDRPMAMTDDGDDRPLATTGPWRRPAPGDDRPWRPAPGDDRPMAITGRGYARQMAAAAGQCKRSRFRQWRASGAPAGALVVGFDRAGDRTGAPWLSRRHVRQGVRGGPRRSRARAVRGQLPVRAARQGAARRNEDG